MYHKKIIKYKLILKTKIIPYYIDKLKIILQNKKILVSKIIFIINKKYKIVYKLVSKH